MWCISLAPDAWNLSWHCQATQDAKDTGGVTVRHTGRLSLLLSESRPIVTLP